MLAGFSADRMAGGAAPSPAPALPAQAQEPKQGGEPTVALETDLRGSDPVEGGVLGEIVTVRMEKPLLAGNPGAQEPEPLIAIS